jgi:hypothetical protein
MKNTELQEFIEKYIPRIWLEPIGEVPEITLQDYERIMTYKDGIPDKLRKWYIIEAIYAFKKGAK